MNLETLMSKVDPQYREQFKRFIQTGEGDQRFLDYLDQNEDCQQAVEQALEIEAAGFRGFAQSLRSEWERLGSKETGHAPAERELQAQLVEALQGVMNAEPRTREEVLEGVVVELRIAKTGAKSLALHELSKKIERLACEDEYAAH